MADRTPLQDLHSAIDRLSTEDKAIVNEILKQLKQGKTVSINQVAEKMGLPKNAVAERFGRSLTRL